MHGMNIKFIIMFVLLEFMYTRSGLQKKFDI